MAPSRSPQPPSDATIIAATPGRERGAARPAVVLAAFGVLGAVSVPVFVKALAERSLGVAAAVGVVGVFWVWVLRLVLRQSQVRVAVGGGRLWVGERKGWGAPIDLADLVKVDVAVLVTPRESMHAREPLYVTQVVTRKPLAGRRGTWPVRRQLRKAGLGGNEGVVHVSFRAPEFGQLAAALAPWLTPAVARSAETDATIHQALSGGV